MTSYLLTIDQGTTSSRAIIFDSTGTPLWQAQKEFRQIYPQDGWVEHDPEEIWESTLQVCRQALTEGGLEANDIAAIGITNQRETTLLWDRANGQPIYNAIVWQDRRTAGFCQELKDTGHESIFAEKTGLLIDPYFSGTKIRWILDNVPDARQKAEQGDLAFGTVDSFLLWRLTGGRIHATDASNASRTLAFDIHKQLWDPGLLDILDVPSSLMPEVRDCAADFGQTDPELFGASIPICAVAGDQQAALFGQTCFEPGMVKSTYGTGCFMVMNTGSSAAVSHNRLLTTVGYRIDGETTYALEGSIFMAGATIQWLRDGIGIIRSAAETQDLAEKADPDQQVYLVPAFTGLGAPYWDPHARAAILGLTRDTGVAEIAKAGLESVAYQSRDLVEAMRKDTEGELRELRVDGGMVVNDWMVQRLSDILGTRVDRPRITETTALGVAYLAGLQQGIFDSLSAITDLWQRDAIFKPTWNEEQRGRAYQGWLQAVSRIRNSN
ncbi:MAG: glycerol kinase GlpK [Arenicellales bacterium]|nr:glycerol kinase GlpK [Arenicellales bacterium]